MKRVLVGFGFGPIQSGLFVSEAYRSGKFDRIVVAEIDAELVAALRAAKGCYHVNIAGHDELEKEEIRDVRFLNPLEQQDRDELIESLAEAAEIVTSLPSVKFYTSGGETSPAGLIAQAIVRNPDGQTIIYTAENNNHAAEVLTQSVEDFLTNDPKFKKIDLSRRFQALNTVIGKMSQVVRGQKKIESLKLTPITDGIDRAFLVESFNRILVSRCRLENFQPGIDVFLEKDDLLPFEYAKLYGHNAIHALLAYLARLRNLTQMSQLLQHGDLIEIARQAFINESGTAMIHKYGSLGDPLFTDQGYREYAEDLLTRMTNPYLNDAVARAARDPIRKLGPDDRIFGTMCLALDEGIQPEQMAIGALAGLDVLVSNPGEYDLPQKQTQTWRDLDRDQIRSLLKWLWKDTQNRHLDTVSRLLKEAKTPLQRLID